MSSWSSNNGTIILQDVSNCCAVCFLSLPPFKYVHPQWSLLLALHKEHRLSVTCVSQIFSLWAYLSQAMYTANYLSDIVRTHTQCIFWVLYWLLTYNSLKLIPWLPCTPLCNQFLSLMFLLVLMAQPFSSESSLAPSSSSAPTFNQLWSHQEFTYPPPGILSLLFPLVPLYW